MRSASRTARTAIRRSLRSREAAALRGELPGAHCKTLFLKDKKGGLWLVAALEERPIDLKRLAVALAAPRFSFGSPALLYEVLGVRPGSVTPFALVNDTARRVTVVLDKGLLERDPLNCHPLENDRTTAIAPGDLLRFIAACGHRPRIVDFDDPPRRLKTVAERTPRCLSSRRAAAMLGRDVQGESARWRAML